MHQNNITENLNQWNKISVYSKWMFNVYKNYIGRRVLDIGGGIGTVINYYIDNVDLVVTTELFENQINFMKERFSTKNFNAFKLDITTDNIDFLKDYEFDTIVCINVLEHIEDDRRTVAIMKSLLKNKGKIIICVPANSSLYCYMDKNVGHFRRYDRGELLKIAEEAQLRVIDNFYFNFMGIIPYWLKGKKKDNGGGFSSDLKENNSKLYNVAAKIMEPIERKFRPCNGISEFIVMEKDN